jgi:hypothetical protein
MRKLATGVGALAIVAGGIFGGYTIANAGQGEGHTPVVVCHWVPAAPAGNHPLPGPDEGSYVVIVVDDDGADGNKNLQAHEGHDNDIIGSDENCGQEGQGEED